MKFLLIISLFLSGCIGAGSENYEAKLHQVEGFIACVSNFNNEQQEKEDKTKDCPCKGTGKVKSGDGIIDIPCPCGKNCKCKKEIGSTPKEELKVKYKRQILFFTANWCTPCQQVKKNTISILEKPEYGWKTGEDEFCHIRYMDVDKNPEYMEKYNFKNIPLFILLEDGKEINRIEGVPTPKQLTDFYNSGKK